MVSTVKPARPRISVEPADLETLRAAGVDPSAAIRMVAENLRNDTDAPSTVDGPPIGAAPVIERPRTAQDDTLLTLARIHAEAQKSVAESIRLGMSMGHDMADMISRARQEAVADLPTEAGEADEWDSLPPDVRSAILRALTRGKDDEPNKHERGKKMAAALDADGYAN